MDKKLKQALEAAYRAPAPAGKTAFLKQHRRRELGRWELAAVQAGYVPWWIWALSLALFGVILAGAWKGMRAEAGLWFAAGLTPFLALLALTENGRSRFCRMDELELACRIPRQSVLLARMLVLGLFHLVLLAGLTPALAVWGAVGAARAGVYLLTPYLLTAALGMELTRRIRGRDGILACGGAAVLVSAAGLRMGTVRPELYWPENFPLWLGTLAAALTAVGIELIIMNKSEELSWN